MGYIHDSILGAATARNILVQPLPTDEAERLHAQVTEKFAHGKTRRLWQDLNPKEIVSTQNPDAWQWIADYPQGQAIFMFFNSGDEMSIFRFRNGSDVVAILSKTPHYEFYLTDANADYLICFNHHDFLIAAGAAQAWLSEFGS